MKKSFKFGAMSLAALLVFGVAGCGKISDKDGAAWAEKNGYVKDYQISNEEGKEWAEENGYVKDYQISDEEGKEWAEENGYVKEEEKSIVGVYTFEYVKASDSNSLDYYYDCSESFNSKYGVEGLDDYCVAFSETIESIEITDSSIIVYPTDSSESRETEYKYIEEDNSIVIVDGENEKHYSKFAVVDGDRLIVDDVKILDMGGSFQIYYKKR